jgi:hypothetical protein
VVSTIRELTCEVKTADKPQYADIPLTVESMLSLPDALTALWELKVLDENPQWRYGLNSDQLEELQKKLRKPSDGSENSTEPQTKAAKAKM